jgi:hypothetical protein
MKIQAHLPTVITGTRNRRAAAIAWVSLFAAVALMLALQSGGLLNNSLLGWMRTPPIIAAQISDPHRVSVNLHERNHPIGRRNGFSVANPLPANVPSSQQFSIGIDERIVFKAFGDAALRDMAADERTPPQLKPRNDRLILMLMLLGLGRHRT